jgi:hypothetical protein
VTIETIETAMTARTVWYAIPSANIPRTEKCFAVWHALGYKTAVLLDEPADGLPVHVADADLVVTAKPYPGYFSSVNRLCRKIDERHVKLEYAPADIVVTGGDDMFPHPKLSAVELASQFYEHFPDGFGVMQPIGDTLGGTSRICGSPWMGRGWLDRAYGGRGPLWHDYMAFYGDQELLDVTTMLGVLWQRPDVVQFHDHPSRRGGPRPMPYQIANQRFVAPDSAIYSARKAANFPHHAPLPR